MSRFVEYNLKDFIIKTVIICIGVTLLACGIALFYALNIGSDPISVFVDGQHRIFGISYGSVNLIDSLIYFVFILIFSRNLINFATLISGFAMGPLINLFTNIFNRFILPKGTFTLQFIDFKGFAFIPPEGDFLVRLLMLIPAEILIGCGLGIYLSANMGAAPVDALVLFMSAKFKKPLKNVKIAFDFIAAILGFFLGGVVGVGTIIAIVMTGPIINSTLKLAKKLNKSIE